MHRSRVQLPSKLHHLTTTTITATTTSRQGMRHDAAQKALEWATAAGSSLDGVSIAQIEGRGRGMVATRALSDGTVLARIVPSVLLTTEQAETLLTSELASAVQIALGPDGEVDAGSTFSQVVKVVCAVLIGRLDPSARYEPLLSAFPDSVESTLLWNEAELSLLQWPESIQEVREMKLWLRRVFLHLSPALNKEVEGTSFTFENFSETFCVVCSRGMDLSEEADDGLGGFFIPPVADMFNFSPGASTAQLSRESTTGALLVTMRGEAEAGTEILVDYGGRRTNANLLLLYGFVARPNPLEVIELAVPAHVRLVQDRHSALVDPFVQDGAVFKAVRAGVDIRVKRALRIASSSPDFIEAGLQQHIVNGEAEENFLLQATDDAELERRVIEALIEGCEASFAKHGAPGSPGGSSRALVATRRLLAKQFVMERAEVLANLIDTLRSQMPKCT